MADAASPARESSAGGWRAGAPRLRAWLSDSSANGVAQRFAGVAYLFRIGNAGIAFLTQIVLARSMGVGEFGIYAYVWTWVLLLGTVTALGLGSSPQRFIPAYRERGEMTLLRGFIDGGRWLALGISTAIAAFAALGLYLFGPHLGGWPLMPFYLGLFCVPLVVIGEVQGSIARTYDWPILAMAPTYLVRPVLLIVIFVAMHLAGMPANAVAAMTAAIGAAWLSTAWQIVALGRRLRARLPAGPKVYAPRAWIAGSLPQFMVEGFYLLLTYSDIIVLERFVTSQELGVYYAATKLVSLIAFVYFSVAASSAHKFSEYFVAGRPEQLNAFMRASIRWTFVPSALISVIILAFGEPLLALFGPEFRPGYGLLPILIIGLLARASIGPAEKLLSMLGHQGACATIYGIAFVVNIALNLALVPPLGLMGAAVATSTALVMESILLFAVCKRRLGLRVFYWGGRKRQAS